jgi:hypothetical protein
MGPGVCTGMKEIRIMKNYPLKYGLATDSKKKPRSTVGD